MTQEIKKQKHLRDPLGEFKEILYISVQHSAWHILSAKYVFIMDILRIFPVDKQKSFCHNGIIFPVLA